MYYYIYIIYIYYIMEFTSYIMADGKTHMTVNVITGASAVATAYYFGLQIEPVLIGSIAGTIITPDYDLMKNLPKSIISRIPIIGWLWYWFWWPYAKGIKHRSFWSHSIFVSTILRFLYLIAPLILLDYILLSGDLSNLLISDLTLIVLIFWSIQDFTHILLDGGLK